MGSGKKTLRTALSSTAAVLIMGAILFMVCLIFRGTNIRIDCTEDGLYTLSDATRNALLTLDRNVTVRFYYSKDVAQMPVGLKNYARRVDDMLREYELCSGGRMKVERLNPRPDSDEEDSANLDGIAGQPTDPLGLDSSIYLGLAVRCGDRLESIPFLAPSREDLLEYDLTGAILSVINPRKSKVGLMSSMKIMGGVDNPQLAAQGQGGIIPAWHIVSELKKRYSVVEIRSDAVDIPEDVEMMILVHPKDVSLETQFALDQFVLRGGRLLAFLDPLCITDLQMRQMRSPRQYQVQDSASNLSVLLKAWGMEFNSGKVVLDRRSATTIRHNTSGSTESMPNILSLTEENLPDVDPSTARISSLVMVNAGYFTGKDMPDIKRTVLVTTTSDAAPADKYVIQNSGKDMLRDFRPEGQLELVVRLTGNFKTAFPDGRPGNAAKGQNSALKESGGKGAVVLVGDSDMLYDAFCVSKSSFFGQTLYRPINDNIAIVQNLMEVLSGDVALFTIRSRGVRQRPFKRVHDMELAANEKFKDEMKRFEDEAMQVQKQLIDMQRSRKSGDRELLSREQKEALLAIKRKEAEVRKNLKKLRRDMRSGIESLENRLMLINIALVPLLVTVFGVMLAVFRRSR